METNMMNNEATVNNLVAAPSGLSDLNKGRLQGIGIAVAAVGLIRAGKFAFDQFSRMKNKKEADKWLQKENPGVEEEA